MLLNDLISTFFSLRHNGREYYNFLRSLQLFKHSLVLLLNKKYKIKLDNIGV